MSKQRLLPWLTLFMALPACAVVKTAPDGEWNNAVAPVSDSRACEAHLRQVHGSSPDGEQALIAEFARYEELVEQALVYRARTIEIGARLKAQNGPLSGSDLQLLNEGMLAHLKLREELLGMAKSHECWLDTPKIAQQLTTRRHLEGVMLSLSAALVLYDNYLLAVSLYEEDTRLRRVLNDSNSGYGIGSEILTGISSSYNSINNRARVRRAIEFYEKAIAKLTPAERADPRISYLSGLIEQSPSYDMTKTFSPSYVVGLKLRFMEQLTRDQLSDVANGGVSLFSMLFGNTVGLVETRKGKLYQREDVRSALSNQLRAGDILLEKTPFRLTDALIPGHWGHAAIWIGNEAELRKLGIWNHPLVARHHEAIREGRGVVEALRAGVEINRLNQFLNIDDLAVLRGRNMDDKARAAVIINAMRQIGKEYDFNFDVETSDRIVCSELIYVTYTDIQWPTTKTLGRSTISPDQVAAKALSGGPLEVVVLYQDGKAVTAQREARLNQLLGGASLASTTNIGEGR